jgi:uroporphyrinogen III methyltransferase/synthase
METTLKVLEGKRILVTRPAGTAKRLTQKLERLGAIVIELPTIEILEPVSYEIVDQAIQNLKEYDWVIFTSVNGVKYFFDRMLDLDVSLKGPKVAAIGSATRVALKRAGREPDFTPGEYLSERSFGNWRR